MREVRAVAKLDHPNIVAAYDVGHERDITYLVMQYVQGTDLFHLIRQHGRLDASRAADIAYQVALALQHASEQGIVHRDIKSSNILITDKGVAKVLDMGLARFEQDEAESEASAPLTQTGIVMGTWDYATPEQTRDSHAHPGRAAALASGRRCAGADALVASPARVGLGHRRCRCAPDRRDRVLARFGTRRPGPTIASWGFPRRVASWGSPRRGAWCGSPCDGPPTRGPIHPHDPEARPGPRSHSAA